MWIDPLGLSPIIPIGMAIAAALGRFGIKFETKALSKAKNIRRTKHVNNRHIDRTNIRVDVRQTQMEKANLKNHQ